MTFHPPALCRLQKKLLHSTTVPTMLMTSRGELRAWLASPPFRPRPSKHWPCLWPFSALLIPFHSFTRSFMVAVFLFTCASTSGCYTSTVGRSRAVSKDRAPGSSRLRYLIFTPGSSHGNNNLSACGQRELEFRSGRIEGMQKAEKEVCAIAKQKKPGAETCSGADNTAS